VVVLQSFIQGVIAQRVLRGAQGRSPGESPQKLKQFADIVLQILTAETIRI